MNNLIILSDLENIYHRGIPWEKLKGKTVLVTGAYGMLASYVVYMLIYLNEKYDMKIQIISIVRFKEKYAERFGKYSEKKYMKLVLGELSNPIDIESDIDYIIHAASFASPQYYSVCPIDVLSPNVIGTANLLKLAEEKNVKGFLYFSSGDVYGSVSEKEEIDESTFGSMDTLAIHNCYSESKRMAETMCKAWFVQKQVPTKIARICHTYAPTMNLENDPRVFASFVDDIVNKKNIIMKSDGMAKRSFCYIADAVVAYFLILLKGKPGEAYNVSNTREFYSISELANVLVSLYPELQLKVVKKQREVSEAYVENKEANFIPISSSKLEKLGWCCEYTVKEGFKRVIDYYMT